MLGLRPACVAMASAQAQAVHRGAVVRFQPADLVLWVLTVAFCAVVLLGVAALWLWALGV